MTLEMALDFILKQEGGYSNDPADAGGLTKFGISEMSYPQVKNPNFSRDDAVAIYRKDFWDACQCDSFPAGFALMLFDARVNQTGQSIRMLQKAIGATADGVIGPKTIAQAKVSGKAGLTEFAALRMRAYGLHPDFKNYALGWSRRLMECFELALSLEEENSTNG